MIYIKNTWCKSCVYGAGCSHNGIHSCLFGNEHLKPSCFELDIDSLYYEDEWNNDLEMVL